MTDLAEIRSAFEFLDSWEDRYKFIIDLGRALPNFPAEDQIEANLVRGCQSQVWIVVDYDSASHRLQLRLDSDAFIVRGLIAIVLAAYQSATPKQVIEFDIETLFDELDLIAHLSQTRGNGLRSMVERVRAEARRWV